MIEPAGSAEKLVFTADSKRQVSIGQAWVRTWTKFGPNVRSVNS